MTETCHCGRPLHYSTPKVEAIVRALIADVGPYIPMTVGGRTWWVQRHYVALHGIRAQDLPDLGFVEVCG